ncbi:MAG: alpha-L-arabinofuranosidase C-terminal domain-containing protein, partial [Promethearchaeota archaeon]
VYHWKDAIGPRESRKKRRNAYWGKGIRRLIRGLGPKILNQFGTDEFLAFCEEIGAKPYLNVNYGTGTPEEAADWVEYCNGYLETKWGKQRAKNGRENPYNVEFWGIANEIFGWWEKGYEKHPENYAKKYIKFAKAMREKDPKIKLIACGCQKPGWNQTLLKLLGNDWIDYLSIHKYIPGLWTAFFRKKHPHNEKLYYALMASPKLFEKLIDMTYNDIIDILGKDTHVRIAFDEWGIWYLAKDIIRTNLNLLDGIWSALILMVFQKMSDKCSMANWAQLINCIGAIQTRGDSIWLTPVYLALKMFADYTYNNLIEDVKIQCDKFDSKKYAHIPKILNTPYISCNTTINNEKNSLSIIIVNKHISKDFKVSLEIKNFNLNEKGTMIELNSQTPYDYNTNNNPNKIQLKQSELKDINPKFEIDISAHSVIVLILNEK